MEYQIVDMEGIVFGRFAEKEARDFALKNYVKMGLARDVEK